MTESERQATEALATMQGREFVSQIRNVRGKVISAWCMAGVMYYQLRTSWNNKVSVSQYELERDWVEQ